MIPLTYIKFILFALCVAAPGSKFVKSTKIDPPALRGLGNNELMITPPTDPSLPMKKPLYGNKKRHGQMNQDLAGTKDPPYDGTIFGDGNIITYAHPNSLQLIEIYDDMQCTKIFDVRTNSFTESSNTHIFKATFSDGIITQFWLRSTDYTRDQAMQQVLKYAKYIGRVPQFIRRNMRVATIQAVDERWAGNVGGIVSIYADHDYSDEGRENGGDITEEALVHEGAHVTIDNLVYADSAWDDAVNEDDAFISLYAKDNPRREDVSESLLLWVGIALGTLNSDDANITRNQIPNRLSYFDNQGYNLFPLGDGIGGEVPGYEWKKLDNIIYYPCGSWEGGAKKEIYTPYSSFSSYYFSEESQAQSPDNEAPIIAITCKGNYCDDKRLVYSHKLQNDLDFSKTYEVGPFSEEGPRSSRTCPTNMVVSRIKCSGHYCDNLTLECSPFKVDSIYNVDDRHQLWKEFHSEENDGLASAYRCPRYYVVDGIGCRGHYCDDIKLHCVKVRIVKDWSTNFVYSPSSHYFSEESQAQSPDNEAPINAIKCKGSYCDNKQLVYSPTLQNDLDFSKTCEKGPFSEEGPRSSGTCPKNMVVSRIKCSGHYCDNLTLECSPFKGDSIYNVDDRYQLWKEFHSEENDGFASAYRCPAGYFVDGIECHGSYCDDIKLRCVKVVGTGF